MSVQPLRFGLSILSLACLSLALGQMPAAHTYAFRHNPVAADPRALGRAQVRMVDAATQETTLVLSGLTPRKAYVAHYHALPAGWTGDPCASNGPVTVGFPDFSADARGRATVSLRVAAARVAGRAGAYINVHDAEDLATVPLCAAILRPAGAMPQMPGMSHASPAPSTPTASTPASTPLVTITDNAFQPAALSVKVGTTVVWKHQGTAVHNVISTTGEFRSGDLRGGDTFSHTFTKSGTYPYYCSYHQGMTATVTVTGQ